MLLSILVIIFSLLYLTWLDIRPLISIVPESDTPTLLQSDEVYERGGQDILSKSPLSRSKLTVDTERVAGEFKARFPEISEVVVITPLASHRLVFEIQPSTPVLLLVPRTGESYVIDEQGRAVVKAASVPQLSKLNLQVVLDESGIVMETGKSVLPSNSLNFITDILAQLKAKKIDISQVVLPPLSNELYIYPTGVRYYVKFGMVGNSRLQAGAFIAAKERLEGEGKTPAEYIDVRTEEKVFYK